MIRKFFHWNMKLSRAFDQLLPADYNIDGNSDFKNRFAPAWLNPNIRVVDIGGGKNPFIALDKKKAQTIYVTGVDISAEELARAPVGAYDAILCGDIATMVGTGDADVCICQAVLEHVRDVENAFVSIASFLKAGGVALIFVPSRNAVFARLNLLLPERLKRLLLFTIFPDTQRDQGFPSYYNRCTPAGFQSMAQAAGLEIQEAKYYYASYYFTFFVPLHIFWRAWIILYRRIAGEQAAETFSVVLKKIG